MAYKICSEADWIASGASALVDVTTLLTDTQAPPAFPHPPLLEIVGNDLNNAPVEAGLPSVTWHWDLLTRDDAAALMAFCPGASAVVYIETRGGDFDFADFKATMCRPTFDGALGGVADFEIRFLNLEEQ